VGLENKLELSDDNNINCGVLYEHHHYKNNIDTLHTAEKTCTFHPHMPIGKVWIYQVLFVCVCVFVRLRISPTRIKLAT